MFSFFFLFRIVGLVFVVGAPSADPCPGPSPASHTLTDRQTHVHEFPPLEAVRHATQIILIFSLPLPSFPSFFSFFLSKAVGWEANDDDDECT